MAERHKCSWTGTLPRVSPGLFRAKGSHGKDSFPESSYFVVPSLFVSVSTGTPIFPSQRFRFRLVEFLRRWNIIVLNWNSQLWYEKQSKTNQPNKQANKKEGYRGIPDRIIEMMHKNSRAHKQTNIIRVKLCSLCKIMPPSIDNFNLASSVCLHESASPSHPSTFYDMHTHTYTQGLILSFLVGRIAHVQQERQRET